MNNKFFGLVFAVLASFFLVSAVFPSGAFARCTISNPSKADQNQSLTVNVANGIPDKTYTVYFFKDGVTINSRTTEITATSVVGSFTILADSLSSGSWRFAVQAGTQDYCESSNPTIVGATTTCDASKCDCSIANSIQSSVACDPARYCEIKRTTGVDNATVYWCGFKNGVSPIDTPQPTTGLGSPKTWLPLVNPGFGPSASLGLGFLTGNIIPFIISILLFLIIVASLVFVVVGGIMWITSSGEKEGLAKAKSTITWSLLGLILGICSFIIMGVLGKLLGANLLGS